MKFYVTMVLVLKNLPQQRSRLVVLAVLANAGATAQTTPAPAASVNGTPNATPSATPNATMASPLNPLADLSRVLPGNYFSRFGMTSLAANTAPGQTAFGVRYFPLPLTADLRLSIVKRPRYWEYSLYTRQNDTTFQVGFFDNGDASEYGNLKLELEHDPPAGVQYAAVIQDINRPTREHATRFGIGYANMLLSNRARLLNLAGVAFQGEVVAPYTLSTLGGGYSHGLSEQVSVGFNATGRLYTYPTHKAYQASIDVAPNVEVRPSQNFTVNVSHFERLVAGTGSIPEFNLTRYQQSDAAATYALGFKRDFSLNMLRTRVTRDWTNHRTYLYNDVLFRINALPVIVGPSVGYQWWPANADGSKSEHTRFIFGVATAPKR